MLNTIEYAYNNEMLTLSVGVMRIICVQNTRVRAAPQQPPRGSFTAGTATVRV